VYWKLLKDKNGPIRVLSISDPHFAPFSDMSMGIFACSDFCSIAVIAGLEFRSYQIIIVFTLPFGRNTQTGNFPRENEAMLLWTKSAK